MIDFTLTPEQIAFRTKIRRFAQDHLVSVAERAEQEPDQYKAFLMYKPAYEKAAEMGLTFGHIPREYGGLELNGVDSLIVEEELSSYHVALGIGNGLAQLPIMLYGTKEQKEKWLRAPIEAIKRGKKDYVCSFGFTEAGGIANFDSPKPYPTGITLTADYHAGEYTLNGRKYWPSRIGGWDMQGADQNVFVVRTDKTKGGKEGLSALVVPRGTKGIEYKLVDKFAMRPDPTCEATFKDAQVPEENLIAKGQGDFVINKVWSAGAIGTAIASVGLARRAFEYALDWSRKYTAASDKPIIQNQVVGYALFDIQAKIEACRYLCWKATHYIQQNGLEAGGVLISSTAKVFASKSCLEAILECMEVMGVNSIEATHPINKILRDATTNPLVTGGNLGIQKRKGWGVMLDSGYDPLMLMENRDMPFKKDMEGWGTVLVNIGPPEGDASHYASVVDFVVLWFEENQEQE